MSNEASRRRGPATEVAGFFNGLLGRPLKKSGAAIGEESASWARREKGAYRAYSTDEQRSTTAPRAGDGGAGLFNGLLDAMRAAKKSGQSSRLSRRWP
jgi:hypothetical protein